MVNIALLGANQQHAEIADSCHRSGLRGHRELRANRRSRHRCKKTASNAAIKPGDACSFVGLGLPVDTIVIAAGAYSGRPLLFQIDQSGNAATQFDVAIHADKPVALLLAAYAPAIWSISWSRGTRVVAVFATGYHRQVVAGLPKETPLITSSYDEKGACGYNYLSNDHGLGWINPKARSVFGAAVTRVYDKAPGGRLDVVESTRAQTAYATHRTLRRDPFATRRRRRRALRDFHGPSHRACFAQLRQLTWRLCASTID